MRAVLLTTCLTIACATTRPTVSQQTGDISRYRFVLIEDTGTISGYAAAYETQGEELKGGAIGKEINPATIIEGLLLEKGLVRVGEVGPEIRDQSLIVKWGISGRRSQSWKNQLVGIGGYAQEVTMALLDAQDLKPAFTCKAEGYGSTDADDISIAIQRCLHELKPKN